MKIYIKSSKYPDFEQQVEARRFLNSVEPEKVKLVEECRDKLLELYAYRDVQDGEYPDVETTIGTRESEILRDYMSIAAEDWEDCTVDEASDLFNDILQALDDLHADDAAAWT